MSMTPKKRAKRAVDASRNSRGACLIEKVMIEIAEAEADKREECCNAIRAVCKVCEGDGGSSSPNGKWYDCQYCGPYVAAIRKAAVESEDDSKRFANEIPLACPRCEGKGVVILRDPRKCTSCGEDNQHGGMGLCSTCFRACWKNRDTVDDAAESEGG